MQTKQPLPPRPMGKPPGTKQLRKRPPVASILDLSPDDVDRIQMFRRHNMTRVDIREIYKLSKGQMKRVLRRCRDCHRLRFHGNDLRRRCPKHSRVSKEDECSRM